MTRRSNIRGKNNLACLLNLTGLGRGMTDNADEKGKGNECVGEMHDEK